MANSDSDKTRFSWLDIIRLIIAILSGIVGGVGGAALM